MNYPVWAWGGFTFFILLMLAIDLGLFNRKSHVVSSRQAAIWSAVWITLALIFAGGVFWRLDNLVFSSDAKSLEFLTGYVVELALSVDNLFVFLLIFSYFKVPADYQHRVLFWGVLGALIMRATMILLGATLINTFQWVIYIFGVFLIFTGLRMFRQDEADMHPEQNPIVRLVQRFVPLTHEYDKDRFFTRVDGRRVGTLLLLVLVIVEVTDLVFAVDSIPAIFGVTTDPFIVYTSNVFAILGLRTFYFLLAGVIDKFHYLRAGLAIVLTFIGVKMVIEQLHKDFPAYMPIEISTPVSLLVVASVLTLSIVASLVWPKTATAASTEKAEMNLGPGFGKSFDK